MQDVACISAPTNICPTCVFELLIHLSVQTKDIDCLPGWIFLVCVFRLQFTLHGFLIRGTVLGSACVLVERCLDVMAAKDRRGERRHQIRNDIALPPTTTRRSEIHQPDGAMG